MAGTLAQGLTRRQTAAAIRRALRERDARLPRYTRAWPASVRRQITAHARGGDPPEPGAVRASTLPYWITFPYYLDSHKHRARSLRHQPILDVSWAQFCLYLAIRITDDIFDGHTPMGSSMFVAQDLIVEAARSVRPHVRSASFWRHFETSLTSTLTAIVRIDELQRQPGRFRPQHARLYANVSSVLTNGIVAAAEICGFRDAESRLLSCADELAMAEQVIDDLVDLEDDLRHGRFTLAYTLLWGSHAPGNAPPSRLPPATLDSLVLFIRCHLERARRAIAPVRVPFIREYVDRLSRNLDHFEKVVYRESVAGLLASLRRPGRDATSRRSRS